MSLRRHPEHAVDGTSDDAQRYYSFSGWLIPVCILALALIASIDYRILKKDRGLGRLDVGEPPASHIQIGSRVPTLEGVGIDGERLALSFNTTDQRPTLVMAFATDSRLCQLNAATWRELVAVSNARSLRPVP